MHELLSFSKTPHFSADIAQNSIHIPACLLYKTDAKKINLYFKLCVEYFNIPYRFMPNGEQPNLLLNILEKFEVESKPHP